MGLSTERIEIDLYDDVSNPLDCIEEVMASNDWAFSRPTEDEMTVHVSGKMGVYKMAFVWQEDHSALKFCCAPDLSISPNKLDEAAKVMNRINTDLWLGHFDVRTTDDAEGHQEAFIPCFRHTSLLRGMNESSGVGHMEDLIDIALSECERYYMTFSLLAATESQNNNEMALAMMDIMGRS